MQMQVLCLDRDVAVLVCVVEAVPVESGRCGPRIGCMFEKDLGWVEHSCWCSHENCGYSPHQGRRAPSEYESVYAGAPRRSLEYPGYRTYASRVILQILRRARSAYVVTRGPALGSNRGSWAQMPMCCLHGSVPVHCPGNLIRWLIPKKKKKKRQRDRDRDIDSARKGETYNSPLPRCPSPYPY